MYKAQNGKTVTSVTSACQLNILTFIYIYIYIYSAQKLGNFLQDCTHSNLNKPLPQNLYKGKAYSLLYLHSTCSQFSHVLYTAFSTHEKCAHQFSQVHYTAFSTCEKCAHQFSHVLCTAFHTCEKCAPQFS